MNSRKKYKQNAILVIRITAIGDIVMASPIANSIKESNPASKVTWVVHPDFADLLKDHPSVDKLITFDIDKWQQLWKKKKLLSMFHMLKELKAKLNTCIFDKAIDLQGNVISGLIAWLSNATHRIALGSEGGNFWFVTKTISRNLGDQMQIGSEYRYLVNQLGYSDANWNMHVPGNPATTQAAVQKLEETIGTDQYAVIVPFAKYPQKNWFDDYWEQIILRIRGRYHLRTVIIGGENGLEPGEKMARRSGALNLAGKTDLIETASIIKGAKLLIGVDTGLTHMGHAVNIPTICLFGATHPYSYAESETSKIIYLDRFCSPCRRNPTCKKRYQCMRDITPDKVLTTIKPLMKAVNVGLSNK